MMVVSGDSGQQGDDPPDRAAARLFGDCHLEPVLIWPPLCERQTALWQGYGRQHSAAHRTEVSRFHHLLPRHLPRKNYKPDRKCKRTHLIR
jgi:hypothetical protein